MSDSQSLTAAEIKSIIDTANAMADVARAVILPRFRSNSLVTENKSLNSFVGWARCIATSFSKALSIKGKLLSLYIIFLFLCINFFVSWRYRNY